MILLSDETVTFCTNCTTTPEIAPPSICILSAGRSPHSATADVSLLTREQDTLAAIEEWLGEESEESEASQETAIRSALEAFTSQSDANGLDTLQQ